MFNPHRICYNHLNPLWERSGLRMNLHNPAQYPSASIMVLMFLSINLLPNTTHATELPNTPKSCKALLTPPQLARMSQPSIGLVYRKRVMKNSLLLQENATLKTTYDQKTQELKKKLGLDGFVCHYPPPDFSDLERQIQENQILLMKQELGFLQAEINTQERLLELQYQTAVSLVVQSRNFTLVLETNPFMSYGVQDVTEEVIALLNCLSANEVGRSALSETVAAQPSAPPLP